MSEMVKEDVEAALKEARRVEREVRKELWALWQERDAKIGEEQRLVRERVTAEYAERVDALDKSLSEKVKTANALAVEVAKTWGNGKLLPGEVRYMAHSLSSGYYSRVTKYEKQMVQIAVYTPELQQELAVKPSWRRPSVGALIWRRVTKGGKLGRSWGSLEWARDDACMTEAEWQEKYVPYYGAWAKRDSLEEKRYD